ncbi:DCC1-like thiol-disulfide oxidoreductase family protein [Kribbella sp. NPDC056951]|uniref:DCC1-like thiol-disulfide oxidoreductase family protein n=1 Tax=Kribbella sp. NPDC056951 TaxID=3345978 RepID=UPI0036380055
MRELTVLYDPHCGLCRRFKYWLTAQAPAPDGRGGVVRTRFVAAGSAQARALYPTLDHEATLRDVTAVADDGSVYVDERAWIMCLWATFEHRATAVRLATPAMRPVARVMIQAVAGVRHLTVETRGGDYADGCDGQCDHQG